jgi:hypothetical protein
MVDRNSLRRRRRLVSWFPHGVVHCGLVPQTCVSGNCAAHHPSRARGIPRRPNGTPPGTALLRLRHGGSEPTGSTRPCRGNLPHTTFAEEPTRRSTCSRHKTVDQCNVPLFPKICRHYVMYARVERSQGPNLLQTIGTNLVEAGVANRLQCISKAC